VAIVGASGSGKSTLIDVMLGILPPTTGSAKISGISAINAIDSWRGEIGYVPQEIFISNSTILENVALGFPKHEIDKSKVMNSLNAAQLLSDVNKMPLGLQTMVGDRGGNLSGGQRQRLGVARALYLNPKLLVMDEATSALDGTTEYELNKSISELPRTLTTIVIAHRLSSIRYFEKVVYMEKGEIKAVGSFDEVRQSVDDFDIQAKLMGLE
jgi:ABC-type bacteriocin/lantibiotic exporter with double-glycine peptidase domain